MNTEETIKTQLAENPILLYMKGTPEIPMCGFSARTIAILESYGKPFSHVNILDFPDIRATLPKMMNWPTFPQLYVNGELIGGCDILCEMHENSELADVLNAVK